MMNKISTIVLAATFVIPVRAGQRPHDLVSRFSVISRGLIFERLADDPSRLPELIEQLRAGRSLVRRGEVRVQTVADLRSARSFIIPAAGSVRGGGGTFFRSDVTLVNYADHDQTVLASWIAQGSSLATPPSVKITLKANRAPVTTTDFVGTVLGQQGLGSIFFIPITATNTPDTNAAVDGFSRIWTNQPNATGTVSQEFPPVDPDSLSTEDEALSMGLRADSGYRTNFGIVNADDTPHTFHVTFIGERAGTEATVTVSGAGMIQQAIPPGDYGALSIVFTVTDSGTSGISWVAYASSTDNITGDGWVSIAAADLTPSGLTRLGD